MKKQLLFIFLFWLLCIFAFFSIKCAKLAVINLYIFVPALFLLGYLLPTKDEIQYQKDKEAAEKALLVKPYQPRDLVWEDRISWMLVAAMVSIILFRFGQFLWNGKFLHDPFYERSFYVFVYIFLLILVPISIGWCCARVVNFLASHSDKLPKKLLPIVILP